MHKELKKAIVIFILDNEKEFQIINTTAIKFKDYIYDKEGNYLLGGEQVIQFIRNCVKLFENRN